MSGFTNVIKKHYRPYIDSLAEDIRKSKDKTFFRPTGTQVYVGKQGSGKTVSAVKHAVAIIDLYPKCILVSNLRLETLEPRRAATDESLQLILQNLDTRKEYIFFSTVDELERVLTQVNNGFHGVLYLIDEIHTYFNSKDSKEMPIWVFQQISQQRKQRKCIVGTSQLFTRVSKPFREQCDNIIFCRTLGGVLTFQTAVDGETFSVDYDGSMSGTIRKRGFFFHNERLRNFYDTYQVINSGSVEFENIVQPERKKGLFSRRINK